MCKNDKNHKHCHSRNLDFDIDKNIEHAVVENGAKEHLKEYEKNGKKKFDYKKFIKEHNEKRKLSFCDLKFDGLFAELLFPNGFMMHVAKDENGLIETVEITDGKDWRHRRSALDMFPDLYEKRNKLLAAADTMILCDVIHKIQELDRKDLVDFRNS